MRTPDNCGIFSAKHGDIVAPEIVAMSGLPSLMDEHRFMSSWGNFESKKFQVYSTPGGMLRDEAMHLCP